MISALEEKASTVEFGMHAREGTVIADGRQQLVDGAQPLARYSSVRRAGDFVFLSGVVAVDPTSGLIVTGFGDLSLDTAELIGRTGEFSVDAKQGPILAQSWYVLDSIRRTVESVDARMIDVVRLVQYFRNLDHFPCYNSVRKLFFPDALPTSTVVQVSGMLPTNEVLIEVEATVHIPQSTCS